MAISQRGTRFKVEARQAVSEFVRLVIDDARIPTQQVKRTWLLVPSSDDVAEKKAYRTILESSLPPSLRMVEPGILYEPEMVLEYFKFFDDARFEADPGANPVILVIDCGALTFNVTIVIGNRQSRSTATLGQKHLALRPIVGKSVKVAGAEVDRRVRSLLANRLGIDPDDVPPEVAESLKISVAERKVTANVIAPDLRSASLTVEDLSALLSDCWLEYETAVSKALETMYDRFHGERDNPYREQLKERGIGRHDAKKLVTSVILAGGSSQLPGFEQNILRILGREVPVLRVGSNYAYVPFMGATAYVRDQLRRARSKQQFVGANLPPIQEKPTLSASLADDIVLVANRSAADREGAVAKPIVLVKSDEWPPLETALTNTRPFPATWHKRTLRVAVAFGADPDNRGKWRVPRLLTGKRSWQQLESAERKSLTVSIAHDSTSIHVETKGPNGSNVSFRVDPYAPKYSNPDAPDDPTEPLGKELTLHVVLDFGMSKTVLGTLDENALDTNLDEEFPAGLSIARVALSEGWRELEGAARPLKQIQGDEEPKRATPEPESSALSKLPTTESSDAAEKVQVSSLEHAVGLLVAKRPENAAPSVPDQGATVRPLRPAISNEWQLVEDIHKYIVGLGLNFAIDQVAHFHLSTKVTPIVLLAGSPGTGKTSLARAYSEAIGVTSDEGLFRRFAVEATWSSAKDLVRGHQPGGFGEFLKAASEDPNHVFVALLDECNLAHMDYYLAPFLSALEDDGKVVVDGHEWKLEVGAQGHRIAIFGTMNVDEASTPITDKVLDRVSLIELDCGLEFEGSIPLTRREAPAKLPEPIGAVGWRELTKTPTTVPDHPLLKSIWLELWATDAPASFRLGHRPRTQVGTYLHHAGRLERESNGQFTILKALDYQILTRILPRLRGDFRASDALDRISKLLRGVKVPGTETESSAGLGLPRSVARVERMQERLKQDQSFSFWTS